MEATEVISSERDEELFTRVQELQEQLESAEELVPCDLARELVRALVDMYGSGLERILASIAAAGAAGERVYAGLADDPFVATLLLIHDLHPVALEDRVQAALEAVRPYMESHGGNVELLSLVDGVARIGLRGSCSDCSASALTLELAIKQALEETAPDLEALEVEGVAPQVPGVALPMAAEPSPGDLALTIIKPARAPAWFEVGGATTLRDGDLIAAQVAGCALLIANVEGTLLAYRDTCAACAGTLHEGALLGGALECPHCGRSFFLPRAGRSMDEERIQLEPVPLLRELGSVKVALAP